MASISGSSDLHTSDLAQLSESLGQQVAPDDGEDDASADVGSTGSLDVINEDTDRSDAARATGFLGKSSAVAWLQRTKAAVEDQDTAGDVTCGPLQQENHNAFQDSTYHAEERDFASLDEDTVYPFDWPPQGLVANLLSTYWEIVHRAFPVLNKQEFMEKFNAFDPEQFAGNHADDLAREGGSLTQDQQHWLCTTNVIFAISAKRAHIMKEAWAGNDNDHRVYIARARLLGMDNRTIQSDPSIAQTTILTLYGLYLLTTDELNR